MQRKTSPTSDSPQLQTLSRDAFWKRHVCQWRDSGMSKMAYCQRYSLVYHQMVYWCSKHKAANADEPTIAEQLNGFVPVSVAPATRSVITGLSIRLPNGLLIEGIDRDNVALLGQIVQQL